PKRTSLDVYNVEDETTSELLSQPQHTNYEAYCPLKDAVFPIVNAPYHQPIDEIGIFLEYLKTSRYELLTTFIPEFQQKPRFSAPENQSLREESGKAVERSATAEFWKMTPVEYIAITKEHFWTKRYYELEQRRTMSQKAYLSLIKRRSPWEYWGYSGQSAMDGEPDATTALRRVKKQLLWRSGLRYTDLVEM
ncbi:MAG: putative Insecticidal toxin complex protein TccB2, partial [Watsoniomyces obsoletus]